MILGSGEIVTAVTFRERIRRELAREVTTMRKVSHLPVSRFCGQAWSRLGVVET